MIGPVFGPATAQTLPRAAKVAKKLLEAKTRREQEEREFEQAYNVPAIEADIRATEEAHRQRIKSLEEIEARLALAPPKLEDPGFSLGEGLAALAGGLAGAPGTADAVGRLRQDRGARETVNKTAAYEATQRATGLAYDRVRRDADMLLARMESARERAGQARIGLAEARARARNREDERGFEMFRREDDRARELENDQRREAAQYRLLEWKRAEDDRLREIEAKDKHMWTAVQATLKGLEASEWDGTGASPVAQAFDAMKNAWGIDLGPGAVQAYEAVAKANHADRQFKEDTMRWRQEMDVAGLGLQRREQNLRERRFGLEAASAGFRPLADGGFAPLEVSAPAGVGLDDERPSGGPAEQDWQQLFADMVELESVRRQIAERPELPGGKAMEALLGTDKLEETARKLSDKVQRVHRPAVWARLPVSGKAWVMARAQLALKEIAEARDEKGSVTVVAGLPASVTRPKSRKEAQDEIRERFRSETGFDLDFAPLKKALAEARSGPAMAGPIGGKR
jgi:hypothetical protein